MTDVLLTTAFKRNGAKYTKIHNSSIAIIYLQRGYIGDNYAATYTYLPRGETLFIKDGQGSVRTDYYESSSISTENVNYFNFIYSDNLLIILMVTQ